MALLAKTFFLFSFDLWTKYIFIKYLYHLRKKEKQQINYNLDLIYMKKDNNIKKNNKK